MIENKCKCGKKISKTSKRCIVCSNKLRENRSHSKETKEKISRANKGSNNGLWKGDRVSYSPLHAWVRRHLKEPEVCSNCKEKPSYKIALDLACINNNYNRDLNNWEYLCRKCHMRKDGRIKNLKQYNNWRCSVCNEPAEYNFMGEKLCKKHWNIKTGGYTTKEGDKQ